MDDGVEVFEAVDVLLIRAEETRIGVSLGKLLVLTTGDDLDSIVVVRLINLEDTLIGVSLGIGEGDEETNAKEVLVDLKFMVELVSVENEDIPRVVFSLFPVVVSC